MLWYLKLLPQLQVKLLDKITRAALRAPITFRKYVILALAMHPCVTTCKPGLICGLAVHTPRAKNSHSTSYSVPQIFTVLNWLVCVHSVWHFDKTSFKNKKKYEERIVLESVRSYFKVERSFYLLTEKSVLSCEFIFELVVFHQRSYESHESSVDVRRAFNKRNWVTAPFLNYINYKKI